MVRLTIEIEVEDMAEGLGVLDDVTNAVDKTSITAVEIEPVTPAYTQTLGYPSTGRVIYETQTPSTGADNT